MRSAQTVSWPGPLEPARKHPLSAEALRDTVGRLGETPFELRHVALDVPDPVLVPRSVLNDLRRRAVALLQEQRDAGKRYTIAEPEALDRMRAEVCRLVSDSPQSGKVDSTLRTS